MDKQQILKMKLNLEKKSDVKSVFKVEVKIISNHTLSDIDLYEVEKHYGKTFNNYQEIKKDSK